MWQEIILTIYLFMWFALVALTVLFILSGLDDLFIDYWYWVRYIYRFFKTRRYQPLSYQQLNDKAEQHIAILIPCWQESEVIGSMLMHNISSIDYENYVLFVGVYPNDLDTVNAVQAIAKEHSKVHCVLGKMPGPTNKASNLNQIYNEIKVYENANHVEFNIFLFHDSEDIIHPLSFKLYNYLIPRKDMVQIPIFPLRTSHWHFTHWLYVDEFSENHTKDIIVRESIQAHVPSAGVGTAFSRRVIHTLETKNGVAFSEKSLTEDYHTSYLVRTLGFKQIFLTQKVLSTQWVKSGLIRKKYKEKIIKNRIATRAMFPTKYFQSVRQKTRWIIGIVFQEWEFSGWPKSWRLRYSLFHDRKVFFTHFISGFAYIVFLFWVMYGVLTRNNPNYPALQEQFNLYPFVWILVTIASLMMIERFVQRFIATTRLYGVYAGILSIPRTFYGNILNLHALLRAYAFYFMSVQNAKRQKPVKWDKTRHHFPGQHPLVQHKLRLGDALVDAQLITKKQLQQALIEQYATGERLGYILKKHRWISHRDLLIFLSKQYGLSLLSYSEMNLQSNMDRHVLPKKILNSIKKMGAYLVAFDQIRLQITIGLLDPTNQILILDLLKHLSMYRVKFVLIDIES